jgi:DNA-binding SARP family transcriptional activator
MVQLHRLRRSLGDPTRIVHRANGYSIRANSDELDVLAFDELSAAARKARAAGALERSADQFTAAVRLWRGAPFDGVPLIALIAGEAQRLEEGRILVRQELLEVGLDLGRHDSLIGDLEALTREHPFRERPIALRMLALYRAGRQAEALQVFRWSRAILREEIGVDPGFTLQRVHEAILRRDERLEHVAVGSLDGEWAPVERPRPKAVPTLAPVPRQLPANVYAFTGRAEALNELEAARLGRPEDGVPPATAVVIAGMAGVGKTSAAVHWAHRSTSDYPDGQLYVNLHGFSAVPPLRPAEALAVMLRSLGLNRDQIPAEPDEAAARLRTETSGRRMLILLDNARSAEQVVPLLPGGSESLVIVTSRSRLRDFLAEHGGYLLRLAPLASTEAEQLLQTLLRIPSSSEPLGVAELARRCGNLPLALRIAAASLAGEPEPDLAEFTRRLAEGSELATLQIGDSPSAAMRATFDCSYTVLPEEVRRVFRLMGVAPVRSFSAEAVAELADTDLESAIRSVEHLVDVHLVDRGGRARFYLHDLTRAYATQLLGPSDPERTAALDRLFNWYVESADVASARRYPGYARLGERDLQPRTVTEADAELAGRWLKDEGENLIGVARYAGGHGHGSVAWRLADILRSHAWTELSSAECIELGSAALQGALEEGSESGEAVAALTLATAHHRAAEWTEVAVHAERAIDLARRIGWDIGRASAHHLMALTCVLIGRPRDSVDHAESALAINRAIGRLRAQSVNLGALAVARGELGDMDEEMRLHSAGLEIADRIAAPGLAASHLRDMASTAVDLGRMGPAERYLDRVVKIDAVTGDGALKSGTSSALAALYSALGDHDTALACAEAAVREADQQGYRTHRALGMVRSVSALNGLGRYAEAVEMADRALAAVGPNRSEEGIVVLAVRAVARVEIGEFEAARADAAQLLALATDGGYRIAEGMALNALAEVEIRGGGPAGTADRAREALDILSEAGHRSGEAWSLWLVGLAAWTRGDRIAAGCFWRRVEQVHTEIGAPIPARYRMQFD